MKKSIQIYLKNIDDSIIPEWKKKLSENEMECDFHPKFSFSEHQDGYLPVKLKVLDSNVVVYKDVALHSGFKLSIKTFDYSTLAKILSPKRSFIQRIAGGNKISEVKSIDRVTDSILQECKYELSFSWETTNSTEMRTAMCSAAVITDIQNGVLHTPGSNKYYDKTGLVSLIFHQVFLLENSLGKTEWKVFPFDDWK